jgi:uncharacterized membrane protein YfcA
MFLEIATTLGAVGGALISTMAPGSIIAVIFGLALIFQQLILLEKKKNILYKILAFSQKN